MTRHAWWQAHPYSLSAGHHPECLRLTVKALGDHSASLAHLKPGTRVIAEGPYGVFTASRRHSNTLVCIAAGVGITPIRAMLDDVPDHADVTVIYRVRDELDLALRAELDDAAYKTGWRMVYLTGDNDAHPMTPELLRAHAPRLGRADVYLCGPTPFANLVLNALNGAGVKDSHIHHEAFAF
jgi:ferredoxin-NADP reductase